MLFRSVSLYCSARVLGMIQNDGSSLLRIASHSARSNRREDERKRIQMAICWHVHVLGAREGIADPVNVRTTKLDALATLHVPTSHSNSCNVGFTYVKLGVVEKCHQFHTTEDSSKCKALCPACSGRNKIRVSFRREHRAQRNASRQQKTRREFQKQPPRTPACQPSPWMCFAWDQKWMSG